MGTRVVTVDPKTPDPSSIKEAASVLRRGGLVAVPTETVYGLACIASCEEAVRRLRRLKQRSREEPLPVQVATEKDLEPLVEGVPLRARPLMKHFWPGPLTLVFPRGEVHYGGSGVGVRIPAHAVAQALLRHLGEPLLVPSCNPRGAPPALTAGEVLRYFPQQLDLVLDAGRSAICEASTVVRVREEGYKILREGLISAEMIAKLLHGKTYLFVCTGNTCRSPMAEVMAEAIVAEHLGVEKGQLQALGFAFLSAGTDAVAGLPASSEAVKAVRELRLDLSGHKARRLGRKLLLEADRVLCMERSHLAQVRRLAEEAVRKALCLASTDIPDPLGGTLAEYRSVRDTIRRSLLRLLP